MQPSAEPSPLAELGEFGLIERLRGLVPAGGPGVILGIGDDAAIVHTAGRIAATCDIQVEGVHFTWHSLPSRRRRVACTRRQRQRPRGDGSQAALRPGVSCASNPRPARDDRWYLRGPRRGCPRVLPQHRGGNVSGTEGPLVIDITGVAGDVDRVLTRSGARPGDGVWVTGAVGKAAAGLFLLRHPEVHVPGGEALMGAYRRPLPRVAVGRLLSGDPAATALLDTSDGTGADLLHLVAASGVGVRIDASRLPVPEGLAPGRPRRRPCPGGTGRSSEVKTTNCCLRPARNSMPALSIWRPRPEWRCRGSVTSLTLAEGRWVMERGGSRRRLEPGGMGSLSSWEVKDHGDAEGPVDRGVRLRGRCGDTGRS